MADLGQEQHVGNDPGESFEFFQAGFEHGFVFLRRSIPGERDLGLAHQIADGRAQLVCQVIGELRKLLHTLVQAVKHEVDAVGQFAEFMGELFHSEPVRQVLGANAGRHLVKLFERPQPVPYQPPSAHSNEQQEQRQGNDSRA
ncbi:hypothetical protein D3C75_786940 [compost metagenome]